MDAFDDIPGTMVFTGQMSQRGYPLNQFCMSLMHKANRDRFVADAASYLENWQLTPEQRNAVLQRDYRAMIEEGGNIFFVLKIAATDGVSVQAVVASFTEHSPSEYAAMMLAGGRSPEGKRSLLRGT